MLRLLLDENISPTVARRLAERLPRATIYSVLTWEHGIYLSSSDEDLLLAAGQQRLTLATYDRRTIEPLLKFWGEHGINHGGVIFVDHRIFRSSDFGGLVSSLECLHKSSSRLDWTNRVVYLSRK